MVGSDPAADDTYTAGNTGNGLANPNEVPALVLALTAKEPNSSQGLAAAIQFSSNAQVTNSAS